MGGDGSLLVASDLRCYCVIDMFEMKIYFLILRVNLCKTFNDLTLHFRLVFEVRKPQTF